jgi:thiamine-phosphate pyrophosphorylase
LDLIILSSPAPVPDEISLLISLFNAGMQLFHLRKPGYSRKAMEAFLDSVPEENHDKIVIHSHHELCRDYHLKGLHVKPGSNVSERISGLTYSCSLHSLEELQSVDQNFDYVFLSPVFDSISKQGYRAGFHYAALESGIRQKKKHKQGPAVIALGGVCADNIEQVRCTGFDGAAVLGALWEKEKAGAMKEFMKLQEFLCQTLTS